MHKYEGDKNVTIDLIEENDWLVGNGEEGYKFNIAALATTYEDTEYLIMKYPAIKYDVKDTRGSFNYYISSFGVDSKGKLFISGTPDIIRCDTIQSAVYKFNQQIIGAPNFFGMYPIKIVAVKQLLHSLEFSEDGVWKKKLFNGTFDEFIDMLDSYGWRMYTGMDKLDSITVDAIGWTDLEESVAMSYVIEDSKINLVIYKVYNGCICADNTKFKLPGDATIKTSIKRYNSAMEIIHGAGKIVSGYLKDGSKYTLVSE